MPAGSDARISGRRSLAILIVLASVGALVSCSSEEASPADSQDRASTTQAADEEADTYSGYVVDPPVVVDGVSLPMADGSGDWSLRAAPGELNLIYFGYTFCPDVCPTTMADVRGVLEALPADEAARVQVAMATVDPGRDTAQIMTDYVSNFVTDGVALRTEDQAVLRAATDAIGANYEVTTADDGEIEVSHTGELYAVDDTATVVMQWPFGTSAKSIERDLRSLLAQ